MPRPPAVQKRLECLRLTTRFDLPELERSFDCLGSIEAVEACIQYAGTQGGAPFSRLMTLGTASCLAREILGK